MLERIERPCRLAGPFLIVAPALLRRPDYWRATAFLLQISCSERVEHFFDLFCAPDNHLVDEGVLGDITAMHKCSCEVFGGRIPFLPAVVDARRLAESGSRGARKQRGGFASPLLHLLVEAARKA